MQTRTPTIQAARFIERAAWIVVLCFFIGTHGQQPNEYGNSIWFGAASALLGVRAFIGHGGSQVTVIGLVQFASALFVGFAGWYGGSIEDLRVPAEYLGAAILAGFAFQLVAFILGGDQQERPLAKFPNKKDANWLAWWAVFVLIGLLVADFRGLTTNIVALTEGAAFTAITMLALGMLWRENARLLSFTTFIIGGAFLVYAELFHSGQGRLRIVALACVLAILYTIRFQRRILKWAMVVITPVALYWLAQQRLSLQETLEAGASAGRTGLESMTVPIVIFGQLLQEQAQGFPKSMGASLFTPLYPLFPTSWFPDAPEAIGYELVVIFDPEKYGSGYSVAATIAGEAVHNFGLVGVLLFAPVLVWLMRLLDKQIRRNADLSHAGKLRMMALVFWVIAGGAVADLVWGGIHIYVLRTLTRLPLLGGMFILAFVSVVAAKSATPKRVNPPHGRPRTHVQRTR